MAWQAADPGTIAQDAQGNYQVKIGANWMPAPKGTIAQGDDGKFHYNADAFTPPAAPAAPAPHPSMLSQVVDTAADAVKPVMAGLGGLFDEIHRGYQKISGGNPLPYNDPSSMHNTFAAPFEHNPNSTPDIDRARQAAMAIMPTGPLMRASAPVIRTVSNALDTAGQRIRDSGPTGATVMNEVVDPALDIGKGALALEGEGQLFGRSPLGALANTTTRAVKGVGKLATTLDPEVAANTALAPNAAQAQTIALNPAIERGRQDGFMFTGSDIRRAVNGPNADVPGLTRSRMTDSGTTERIQQHNQALATSKPAQDVGITNAADPAELQARIAQEGKAYDDLGQQVGNKTKDQLSPTFDTDLGRSAQPGASQTSRDAVQSQVQFYQDAYKNGLQGPTAVNDVKHLRQNATKQMASMDPDTQALGKTNLNIANAIEDELMRQLPAGSDLATRFPVARTQLAKLYEFQEAMQGGQVNPQKYLQLKLAGAPLTGAADSVANAAAIGGRNGAVGESFAQPITPSTPGLSIGHYGGWRTAVNAAGRAVRALPGMDESSEAFQRANYGPFREPPPPVEAANAPTIEPYTPAPDLRIPEALRAGVGASSKLRYPDTPGRSSGYSELATEKPGPAPGIPAGLGVGEGKASNIRYPDAPGRSSGYSELANEKPVAPVAPPTLGDELALGSNRVNPAPPTSLRGGPPSGYSQLGMEPAPAPPERLPESLALGADRVRPAPPTEMRGGPSSGYSELATSPRTLGDELALGSNVRNPAPATSARGGPNSGYSRFGSEEAPEAPKLSDALALGSNRVSPAPPTTMRGGPSSGYSQLGMEPAAEAPKLSDVVAPKTPNSRAAFDAAAAAAVQSSKLRDAMAQIDPRTLQGAPVGLDTLRANSGMSKEAFDKAIADGIAKGEFAAQSHAWPARLTDADKAKLVPNGRGGFYDSIAIQPPKS